TNLKTETLSVMAGRQLPFISLFIPLYMVKCMCSWKQTWEVWPALVVSGGSFASFQFVFATVHYYVPGLVLYPMTDIGGGIFSLVVTAILLQFWKPAKPWHFDRVFPAAGEKPLDPNDPHTAEAAALLADQPAPSKVEKPLTPGSVSL